MRDRLSFGSRLCPVHRQFNVHGRISMREYLLCISGFISWNALFLQVWQEFASAIAAQNWRISSAQPCEYGKELSHD